MFKEWFNEAWVQRSIRQRMAQAKPSIDAGYHPTIKNPDGSPASIDYKNAQEGRRDFLAAAKRAQDLNKLHPEGVTVYHSIVPHRMKFPLEKVLSFMVMNKNPREEQSVSVKKGLWDSSMVLVGKTKKLLAYWDTDVHTKGVPNNSAMKIPLDSKRSSDFRPYDEALVRLGDVKWQSLHYNSKNEELLQAVGGEERLKQIADFFGLQLNPIGSGNDDALIYKRHDLENSIDHVSQKNQQMYKMILSMIDYLDQHKPHLASQTQDVKSKLNNFDVSQKHLMSQAPKRLDSVKFIMNNLIYLYHTVHALVNDDSGKGYEV